MPVSVNTDLASFFCQPGARRRILPALSVALWCGLHAAMGATFSNPTDILINLAGGPPGVSPYPSPISVAGLAGSVTNVTVTLSNVSHSVPDDLDILLLGPGGQRVLLMSDAGDSNAINSVRLTFSDDVTASLPDNGRIVSGVYRPTNYGPPDTNFPANTPGPPYGSTLSVFDGTNPNGTWRLFVHDDTGGVGGGSGIINGGWQLNLGVAILPPVIVAQPQDQTAPLGGTAMFQVAVTGTPPFSFQWLRNGQIFIPFGQGGPALTLADLTAADFGVYAVMIANAANPNGVRSDDAKLILLEPVAFASQPLDQVVPAGGTAVFQVEVTGTPPFDYQWLRNGAVLVPFGLGGPELRLANVGPGDAGIYAVVVRNAASPNGVRSADARLIVLDPVVITTHPQDQTVPPGGTATFQVGVSGTPPFRYQWLRNGQIIVPFSQGGPTLTVANAQDRDAGYYSVRVANDASPNGVLSAEAFLNIDGPLRVIEPPPSVVAQPGANVRLRVIAAGRPPIRYQWTLNGAVLPDQNWDTLDLLNVDAKSGGNYQVVLWNDGEATTTERALVLVRAATGPSPADLFDARPMLEGPQGVLQGNNAQAGTEPGEPIPRGGGKTMWFEWQALESGIVTVGARGSAFDTLLAVYTGTKVSNLTLVTRDDDRGGFYTSSLQFNAVRGVRYLIQLDGFGLDGLGGEFTVCWSIEPTQELIPVIVEEPASQSVRPGGVARFRVVTDGQPAQYQWFFNGNPIPNATDDVLTIPNAKSAHVGRYAVRLINQSRRVLLSEIVNLQLGSFDLPVAQDKVEEVYFAFRSRSRAGGGGLQAASGGSLGAGYMAIGLGNIVSNEFAAPANHQPTDPNPCGGAFLGTLWQGLFATNSGPIQVHTIGSDIPARLAIYHLTGGLSDLTVPPIVCDLTSASNGLPVIVQFDAQQGSNYLIEVEGFQAAGNIELNCLMGAAPPLTNPLRYCFVAEGGSFLLTMPATNWFPTPVCQWRFEGADLPGETGTTLLVNNFGAGKVGVYSVWMSNYVGTATRDVAHLALAGPFLISHWWATNGSEVGFVLNASNSTPFVLETSTNLNGSWLPIATNPDPCLILLYTNLGALTQPQRFFRAAPWPPIGP
jgi:subtilisin-like proprotein convertase family protein